MIWTGHLNAGQVAKVELSVYDNRTGDVFLCKIVDIFKHNLKQKSRYDFEKTAIHTYGNEYYLSIVPVEIPQDADISVVIAEKEYSDNHLFVYDTEQKYDIYLSVLLNTKFMFFKLIGFLICMDLLLVLSVSVSKFLDTKEVRNQNTMINILKVSAAVAVFLCHWGDWIAVTGILDNLTSPGVAGTNIFFVITGFTIWQSVDKEVHWNKFYIKRLFRIVPLYYCVIIIVRFFVTYGNYSLPVDSSGLGWVRYFLFLSTIIPTKQDYWVNLCATWSVSCFLVFYVSVPVLKRVIVSFKSSMIMLVASYIFCNGVLARWLDEVSGISKVFPLLFLWIFLLGVLAYYALKEDRVLDLCFVAGMILLFKIFGGELVNGRLESSLMCVLILVSKFEFGFQSTRMDKIFAVLGKYTYSLYLCHPMVWYISTFYRDILTDNYSYTVFLIITIGCTTYILYNLIELPSKKVCQWICKKVY